MSESQQLKTDMAVASSWREPVALGGTLLFVVMVVVGLLPRRSAASPGVCGGLAIGDRGVTWRRYWRTCHRSSMGRSSCPGSLSEELPDTLLPVFRGRLPRGAGPFRCARRATGGAARPSVAVEMAESATDSLSTGSPDRLPLVVTEPVKFSDGLPADYPDTSLPARGP